MNSVELIPIDSNGEDDFEESESDKYQEDERNNEELDEQNDKEKEIKTASKRKWEEVTFKSLYIYIYIYTLFINISFINIYIN